MRDFKDFEIGLSEELKEKWEQYKKEIISLYPDCENFTKHAISNFKSYLDDPERVKRRAEVVKDKTSYEVEKSL